MTSHLVVRAQPGTRRVGFVGWVGDLPKFAVRAPAADGAANEALERELASTLGLSRRAVRLVAGASSRTKRFAIEGLEPEELERRVRRLNPLPTASTAREEPDKWESRR